MKTKAMREKQKAAAQNTRIRVLNRQSFCTETVDWKCAAAAGIHRCGNGVLWPLRTYYGDRILVVGGVDFDAEYDSDTGIWFMPNGSLDTVLYQESEDGATTLKWRHRYNIAMGMASVLTYLHQECEQQVIHRDIKTNNIMLDGNFNARLGDFGLARLMDHNKSPVSTLTAGTMGYLAPKYLQYGKATDKTDVFSYGVVILEVACGRRPIEKEHNSQRMVNLVDWVWGLYSQGRIIDAAYKRLNGEYKEEDMVKLLLVGLSCANPNFMERPTMRKVLQILNDEALMVFNTGFQSSNGFQHWFKAVKSILVLI